MNQTRKKGLKTTNIYLPFTKRYSKISSTWKEVFPDSIYVRNHFSKKLKQFKIDRRRYLKLWINGNDART